MYNKVNMKSLKIFSLAFLLLTLGFISVAIAAPTQAPPAGGAIQITPSANNQGALTIDTNGVVNLTDALPLTSGGTGAITPDDTGCPSSCVNGARTNLGAAKGLGPNDDITAMTRISSIANTFGSGGPISIISGGANQNITLDPSGTGNVSVIGDINTSGRLKVDGNSMLYMPSNNPETGPWNPIWNAIGTGRSLFSDEEFASGNNSVSVYNNSGGTAVTITRETGQVGVPNSTAVWLKVSYDGVGATSPNFGGVVQSFTPAANKTYVQRFRAKIPVGKTLNINENSQGTNSTSYWLTNNVGTGKWEDYVRVSHAGNTGTFSVGGHISISGGSGAFNWYISSMNAYEVNAPIFAGANTWTATQIFNGNVGIGAPTPSRNLHIRNSSDAAILLEADTASGTEDNNAYIKFLQDGGGTGGYIGMVGDSGKDSENALYTGTLANSILISNTWTDPTSAIHFGVAGVVRMTVGNGNIGIGDTTPASLLTVGDNDLFQVNSSGNIIKINNIAYSWPSAQGAASTYLQNNGSGTLSWAAVASSGGTVTSVGLSLPNIFTVSGSPVTASGTLTGALATQTANTVFAGPTAAPAAAPTFRALVPADIPTLNQSTTGNADTATSLAANGTNCGAGFYSMGIDASGNAEGCTSAGGGGTVTSVSVTTANGVSGSVATATTTPAISLTLGAITPTTVNGLTLTAQSTGFTIAGGTTSRTLTVDATGTAMVLGVAQTVSASKTFNSGTLILAGATSGTTTLNASATASGTLTLPATTDTLVGKATTDTLTNKTLNLTNNTLSGTTAQFNTALSDNDFATIAGTETLTNKTLTTPTIGSFANANHNHTASASGGQLTDAALSSAVGVAKGGTGNTTFTAYSIIAAGTTATGTFQNVVGVGTSGQVLTSNGASQLPSWQGAPGGWTRTTATTTVPAYLSLATATDNVGLDTTPYAKLHVKGIPSGNHAGQGTITDGNTVGSSISITGISTLFTSELRVGDLITAGGTTRAITAITSDTAMTLDDVIDVTNATFTYQQAIARFDDSVGTNRLLVDPRGRVSIRAFDSLLAHEALSVLDSTGSAMLKVSNAGWVSIGAEPQNTYKLYVGGTAKINGSLEVTGTITGCSNICSDIRLKKNIKDITNVLDKIEKINGVTFDWRREEFPERFFTDKKQLGLIAQEVEKVFPELITYDKEGYRMLDYGKFSAVLLEAIKEQQKEIESQKTEMAVQAKMLSDLKKDVEMLKKTLRK